MQVIDAHQHYWQPARGDYDWMPMDNPVLARVYDPSHLTPILGSHGIDRTVLVQAAATVNETEYMLGLADATSHVAGVVGWIDFEDESDRETLARLGRHPKMVGVRPMIQDIDDVDWMLRPDIDWAFRAVIAEGLAFDALGAPRHLENFLVLMRRHPELRVVIDHCMKPQISSHSPESFDHWARGMSCLARETGAFCKLSGLVSEADDSWTIEDLRPYVDHVLGEFGAGRVMWGSDWPVCRLRAEYGEWLSVARLLTGELDTEEKFRVFGRTAIEFYGLAP